MFDIFHCSQIVDDVDLWWATVLKPCCVNEHNFFTIRVLGFRRKNSRLFGAGNTSGTDLKLFGYFRVLCFKFLVILAFSYFSQFYTGHFEEKCCLSNSRNTCDQDAVLVLDLFLLFDDFFLGPVNFVDVENFNLLSDFPPKVNFFFVRSVWCLNFVDMLQYFLVVSVAIQKFFNLFNIVWAWLLL